MKKVICSIAAICLAGSVFATYGEHTSHAATHATHAAKHANHAAKHANKAAEHANKAAEHAKKEHKKNKKMKKVSLENTAPVKNSAKLT